MRYFFIFLTLFLSLLVTGTPSMSESSDRTISYTISQANWVTLEVNGSRIDLTIPIHVINHVIYVPMTPEISGLMTYGLEIRGTEGLKLRKIWGESSTHPQWNIVNKSFSLLRYDKALDTIPLVIHDGPIPYVAMNTNSTPDISAKLNNGVLSIQRHFIEYPPQFSVYDWVDKALLIRNQGSASTCWAYAANTLVEIDLAKNKGLYYDFSERHMIENSPIPVDSNSGGNFQIAFSYFQNLLGPVTENQPNVIVSKVYGYEVIQHNINTIKSRILERGAVVGSIFFNTYTPNIFDTVKNAYYNPHEANRASHDVVIVGWDDSYSKDNFIVKPKYDGAFIVQNSFGANWGDEGLFYVSYEDAQLSKKVYALTDTRMTNTLVSVYTHASTGVTHYETYETFSEPILFSKFTAKTGEKIHGIGFYSELPQSKVRLYYATESLEVFEVGTFYGISAGYKTIFLQDSLILKDDRPFYVGLSLETKGNLIFPIEAPYPNMQYIVDSKPDQAYIYDASLNTWTDLYAIRPMGSLSITTYTIKTVQSQ